MDARAVLAGLTDRQAEAVTTPGAPLCILAGAGSGKTRVLTRRIAYRVLAGTADPRHVMALTFTRKAAGELVRRLEALGVRDHVTAGTFHALAYAQLRQRWADTERRPPALLDRKAGLLIRLLGRGAGSARVQPADLAGEIEWAKARLIEPGRYEAEATAAERRPPVPLPTMAAVYERYEQEKRRRGLVDFDDLLLGCASALADDPEFAASQRWRFRHLFVDEFQDVNLAQARLLAGWRGDSNDLCVVGDPRQAIYSWNGAEPAQLRDFAQREAGATVISLDDNFRSTPQILAVASAVISVGAGHDRPLRPRRPDGPLPTVRAYARDVDEARAIARAVRDRHRPGTSWSHTAVLCRTNAQLVLFEEAFRAAGIPHRVRGGGAFLQRPEVKAALAELRRSPAPLATGLADLRAPADDEAGADDGPADGSPVGERQAVLEELARLGDDYLTHEPDGDAGAFEAWLGAALRSEAPGAASDAVELATFHGAKGLEWPVVFVTGLERGLVPISHAGTDEARAEEQRLLYVAVTRAQDQLHCSWARERSFGARSSRRQPSPWLDDISAARAALAGGSPTPGSPGWHDRLGAERARLRRGQAQRARGGRSERAGTNADPELLAALKRWRSEAARAGGVPAFVVFHDSTLAAVAEAKPRTSASLVRVPGLGPVKAERYGAALLALVSEHAEAGSSSGSN
ncbi:MAG TPA: ATP-dependent DNA helicase UvrD2 [Acidimicrobiales bacterium]|nr:ATP-dependent DNA helicase UvrD2 [Acidimicrobiales bacterium]